MYVQSKDLKSRGGKRTSIQQDLNEGDASILGRRYSNIFEMDILFDYLGHRHLHNCHTIYSCKMVIGRRSSQSITMEVFIERKLRGVF